MQHLSYQQSSLKPSQPYPDDPVGSKYRSPKLMCGEYDIGARHVMDTMALCRQSMVRIENWPLNMYTHHGPQEPHLHSAKARL